MQLSETYSVTSFLEPIINTGLNICLGSTGDYEPFGSALPYRGFNNDKYRFGFNGQEKDNEIGTGIYTAQFWEYDSRIGRRWNPDPITYPWQSSYACFNNNPIYFADPSGLEGVRKTDGDGEKYFQARDKDGKLTGKPLDTKIDEVNCSPKSTKSSWFGKVGKTVGNVIKKVASGLSEIGQGFAAMGRQIASPFIVANKFLQSIKDPDITGSTIYKSSSGDVIPESNAIEYYTKEGGYNSDIKAQKHYGRLWDVTNYMPGTVMGPSGATAKEKAISNYLGRRNPWLTAGEHMQAVSSTITNIVSAKEIIQKTNNASQQMHNTSIRAKTFDANDPDSIFLIDKKNDTVLRKSRSEFYNQNIDYELKAD